MAFYSFTKIAIEKKVEIRIGFCYDEGYGIAAGDEVDEWFGRVWRPNKFSGEREEVLECERERVFEFWKNWIEENSGWVGEIVEEKAFNRRESEP